MKAVTLKGNNADEIDAGLRKVLSSGYRPTLAFVFIPFYLDAAAFRQLFSAQDIQLMGASSYGSFSDRDYDSKSIIVMLLDLHPDAFRILSLETNPADNFETAFAAGKKALELFSNPAIVVLFSGINNNGELILNGISEGCRGNAAVFGGAASAVFSDKKNFIFTHDATMEYAMALLVLDASRIEVKGLASGGWQPLGTYHTITRSEGNVVFEINGIPALDCLAKYTGISLEKVRQESGDSANPVGYFVKTGTMFQLEVHREGKAPVMRASIYGNFEDKSLVFGGSVPQGSRVIFSILPGFDTTDHLVAEYEKYHEKNPDAEAVILFSCSGRELSIGPWIDEELDRIQSIWKSPMAGFFTYGEIGPDKNGQNDFHNLTCSLMLLSEKTK